MAIPTITKPDTIAALEQLVEALRGARERSLGQPLAGDEEETFAVKMQGLTHIVAQLDPDVHKYVLETLALDAVQQIIGEELAAGRLIDHGDGVYERPEHLKGAFR